MNRIDDILQFWFGPKGAPDERREAWFKVDAAFDDAIRRNFGYELEAALADGFEEWSGTADGNLALILLLDQFTRNLFRGHAKAYAGDARALRLAKSALARGHDCELGEIRRGFLYLPFEHSESPADQERSVELFEALGDEVSLDFAIRHRDVIARFGRFPSRNQTLGRDSTPDEIAFLKQTPLGF